MDKNAVWVYKYLKFFFELAPYFLYSIQLQLPDM